MPPDTALSVDAVSVQECADLLASSGRVIVPEQTPRWLEFEETMGQRRHWGSLVVREGDRPLAAMHLLRVDARAGSYLWGRHAPVWLVDEGERQADRVVEALTAHLRAKAPWATYLRADLPAGTRGATVPEGIIGYDRTIVVDTTLPVGTAAGTEAALDVLLTRMRKRGRRDVRKALRESGLEAADETARGTRDFSEYHQVMAETALRDGFIPWGPDVYRQMLETLGPDHSRLYVGRMDGRVACWSIEVMNGPAAWHYYAASTDSARGSGGPDALMAHALAGLAVDGISQVDLMGIGSKSAPDLDGLTGFKRKFTKSDPVTVDPIRDIPLRPIAFRMGQALTGAHRRVRGIARGIRASRGA